MLPIASIVLYSLFGVVSLIHIYFCFIENQVWRRITKPLCLALLIPAVITANPKAWALYVALIFGLIGDIILLYKNNKHMFKYGGIAFAFGHVFYIVAFIQVIPGSTWWHYLCFVGAYAIFATLGYIFVRPKLQNKMPRYSKLAVFYFSFLLTLLSATIALTCATGNPFGAMAILGAVLFFTSDSILTYGAFFKVIKKRPVYVMSTYLTAQFFLTFSLLMIMLA